MGNEARQRRTQPHVEVVAGIRSRLRGVASPGVAEHSQRFFKTGPGEYGEGDRFIGIRVPVLRKIAREFRNAPAAAVLELLRSPLHEERLLALFLMVDRFKRGTQRERTRLYRQYLRNIKRSVNSWDLVDCSAHEIVGGYLEDRDRQPLYELGRSKNLWERRVAIMATFRYIKQRSFEDALGVCTLLVRDEHDLIHKAAGWMLREIGKRDRAAAEAFLREHCRHMPRTMLRYATEKFPPRLRRAYLAGAV